MVAILFSILDVVVVVVVILVLAEITIPPPASTKKVAVDVFFISGMIMMALRRVGSMVIVLSVMPLKKEVWQAKVLFLVPLLVLDV